LNVGNIALDAESLNGSTTAIDSSFAIGGRFFMAETQISVVVPYRNRSVARLEALFASLQAQTRVPFEFVVSDYGSSEPFRGELSLAARKNGWLVVRSEAQGLPWNRARSINTGVRACHGPWVSVIDVDMVLHDPILDHLLERIGSSQVWFVESRWAQSSRQDPLKGLRHKSYGVFQLIHRRWFELLHGFCEDFEFWGSEDTDWVVRLRRAGAEIHWLPTNDYRLTHTWHPWENNSADRPATAVVEAMEIEIGNGLEPYSNPDWGRPWLPTDRPILNAMAHLTPHVITEERLTDLSYLPNLKELLDAGKLLQFQMKPRIPRRRLTRWAELIFRIQPLFNAFSIRLDYQVQTQLEAVLILRKILGKDRVDIFLEPPRKTAFLLLR
jgi:hypothetical protein